MKSISTGKILITIVALMTAFGSYIFDWNHTHIFNPNWPPHAKFHNAQTMILGTLLGLLVLWLLWIQKEYKLSTLRLIMIVASLYWIGQIGAFFFPGTALVDPEFEYSGAQLYVCLVLFVMLTLAYILETIRLKKAV